MNVYDFDDTIYHGDSTVDFYKYCLKKKPLLLLKFPYLTGVRFLLGFEKKVIFKERFYRFLTCFDDIDSLLSDFWRTHLKNIKPWYYSNQRPDDVVISASPEFLLTPICQQIGIQYIMASRVDKATGKYTGENCWGKEKVRRFGERFSRDAVDCFYSDSLSDTPMAYLAKKAYVITGESLTEWHAYERTHKRKHAKYAAIFAEK